MLDFGTDFFTARSGWLFGLVRPLDGLERNLAESLGARAFFTGFTSLIPLAKGPPPFAGAESLSRWGPIFKVLRLQ